MEAIVFFPEKSTDLEKIIEFAKSNKLPYAGIDEDEKKLLAGRLLANLSNKNPKAYATMDEISSVVEEVRNENFYGKNK